MNETKKDTYTYLKHNQACMRAKVENVISLSTDEPANPVDLYGASKLASDKIFRLSETNLTKVNFVSLYKHVQRQCHPSQGANLISNDDDNTL